MVRGAKQQVAEILVRRRGVIRVIGRARIAPVRQRVAGQIVRGHLAVHRGPATHLPGGDVGHQVGLFLGRSPGVGRGSLGHEQRHRQGGLRLRGERQLSRERQIVRSPNHGARHLIEDQFRELTAG